MRRKMNSVWIPLAIALAACGGATSPDAPNETTVGSSVATSGSGSGTSSGSGSTGGGSGSTGNGTSGTTDSSSTTTSSSSQSVGSVGASGTTATTGSSTPGCAGMGMDGAGGASGGSAGARALPPPADAAPPSDIAPPPSKQGIVLRLADFPPGDVASAAWFSTPSGADPDTQFIMVGNVTPSCNDPWGGVPTHAGLGPPLQPGQYACGTWRFSIGIPPADFKPGTFPLANRCANIEATFSMRGADPGGGDCGGEGGFFTQGTLEILSVTTTAATIRLTHAAGWRNGVPSTFEFNSDGVYELSRCPARP